MVVFPPSPPLGSRHEQSLQYWVFTLGPQQSPPSYEHAILLFISSQYPSAIHPVLHPAVVDWPPVEVVIPPVVIGDAEVIEVEVAVEVGVVLGVVLGVMLEVVVGVEVEVVVVVGVAVGVVLGVVLEVVVEVEVEVVVGVAVEVVLEVVLEVVIEVMLEVVIVVVVMFSRFEDVRLSGRIELNI